MSDIKSVLRQARRASVLEDAVEYAVFPDPGHFEVPDSDPSGNATIFDGSLAGAASAEANTPLAVAAAVPLAGAEANTAAGNPQSPRAGTAAGGTRHPTLSQPLLSTAQRRGLQLLQLACLDVAADVTSSFVWHVDPFQLSLPHWPPAAVSGGPDEGRDSTGSGGEERGEDDGGWFWREDGEGSGSHGAEELEEHAGSLGFSGGGADRQRGAGSQCLHTKGRGSGVIQGLSNRGRDAATPAAAAAVPRHCTSASAVVLPHLFGRTRFGACIDDEWLVVWLLLEISRKLPHVSIAVRDGDGQFLAAEAAYAIPRWLAPATSGNRIFLRQGKVHIIPPPPSSSSSSTHPPDIEPLDLPFALSLLRNPSIPTEASEKVQAAIRKRLEGFPGRQVAVVHRARCRVPIGVARVLRREPQMVSLAAQAYLQAEGEGERVRRMSVFSAALAGSVGGLEGEGFREGRVSEASTDSPASPALQEGPQREKGGADVDQSGVLVDVMVRFSRAMFAQLLLTPPAKPPLGYPMPFPSDRDFRAAGLGLKIALGFEMMAQRGQEEKTSDGKSALLPWGSFCKILEERGYFGDLKEASRERRKVQTQTEERYDKLRAYHETCLALRHPSLTILRLLSETASLNRAAFPPSDLCGDDSEAWMETAAREVEGRMVREQKEIEREEEGRRRRRRMKREGKSGVEQQTGMGRDEKSREMRGKGSDNDEGDGGLVGGRNSVMRGKGKQDVTVAKKGLKGSGVGGGTGAGAGLYQMLSGGQKGKKFTKKSAEAVIRKFKKLLKGESGFEGINLEDDEEEDDEEEEEEEEEEQQEGREKEEEEKEGREEEEREEEEEGDIPSSSSRKSAMQRAARGLAGSSRGNRAAGSIARSSEGRRGAGNSPSASHVPSSARAFSEVVTSPPNHAARAAPEVVTRPPHAAAASEVVTIATPGAREAAVREEAERRRKGKAPAEAWCESGASNNTGYHAAHNSGGTRARGASDSGGYHTAADRVGNHVSSYSAADGTAQKSGDLPSEEWLEEEFRRLSSFDVGAFARMFEGRGGKKRYLQDFGGAGRGGEGEDGEEGEEEREEGGAKVVGGGERKAGDGGEVRVRSGSDCHEAGSAGSIPTREGDGVGGKGKVVLDKRKLYEFERFMEDLERTIAEYGEGGGAEGSEDYSDDEEDDPLASESDDESWEDVVNSL